MLLCAGEIDFTMFVDVAKSELEFYLKLREKISTRQIFISQ